MQNLWVKDYIGNSQEALNAITDFTKSKYIIKGSTGIGGTTSVLQYVEHKLIILAPLTGLIRDKERSIKNQNTLYIYGGTEQPLNRMYEAVTSTLNTKVMCTPEMLMRFIETFPEALDRLLDIPVFYDETHIPIEADYRADLAAATDYIYNNWKANFILSSATPQYNFVEVPERLKKQLEFITISREGEQPKPLRLLDADLKLHYKLIKEQLNRGERVVVFTNDESEYNKLYQLTDNIQRLTGGTLRTKLSALGGNSRKADNLNKESELDDSKQLFILSTKFATGFDIPFTSNVYIYAKQRTQTDCKTVYDIVQSLGRSRNGYTSATLVYNQFENYNQRADVLMFNIKQSVNYTADNQSVVQQISQSLTYNIETLEQQLERFNVKLIKNAYKAEVYNHSFEAFSFKKKLNVLWQLVNKDFSLFLEYFSSVTAGFKIDKEESGYNFELLTAYSVVYFLFATSGNQYADELVKDFTSGKRFHKYRLISKLFTFIYLNDQRFHQYYNSIFLPSDIQLKRCKNAGGVLDQGIDELIKKDDSIEGLPFGAFAFPMLSKAVHSINFAHVLHSMYEANETDEGNRIVNNSKLIDSGAVLRGAEALGYMRSVIRNEFNTTDEQQFIIALHNQRKSIRKVCKNVIAKYQSNDDQLMLIERHIGSLKRMQTFNEVQYWWNNLNGTIEHHLKLYKAHLLHSLKVIISNNTNGFKISHSGFREYNPATKCSRLFRYHYTPYKMVEADVKSANPQIIDSIIGSDVWRDVYSNLMEAKGISRQRAKKEYNTFLNGANISDADKLELFKLCGYTLEQCHKLIEITKRTDNTKLYYEATEVEQREVESFKELNNIRYSVRVHDALIFPLFANDRVFSDTSLEFGVEVFG